MFKPELIMGKWKAVDERGAQCLHLHRSRETAQRCADQCNKPALNYNTPQGAWDHAAGYHD